jgi:carbonic anhydrase
VQASPAQLALFSRLYPFNARPIQASSGRMIKESN